jgi:heme exporter protein D
MGYVYAGYAVIIGLLAVYAVVLVVRRRRLVGSVAQLARTENQGRPGGAGTSGNAP